VNISALLYHHIGKARKSSALEWLTVSPVDFAEQMEWLSDAGYATLTPSELDQRLGSKSVMLMFDDGYADLAEQVFPVLERMRQRATVFIPTSLVGKTSQWEHLREDWLPLLSIADLKAASTYIEWGSHGRTHRSFEGLSDSELAQEVHGSSMELQALMGVKPAAIAYPYGFHDARVHNTAKSCFRFGFTVDEGMNTAATGRMQMRRTMVVATDSLFDFSLRVKRGRNLLANTRGYSRLTRWWRGLRSAAPEADAC
jgi:peptidoglycan/xylan/chitin deacetylase (PgdA/CDA1 family)